MKVVSFVLVVVLILFPYGPRVVTLAGSPAPILRHTPPIAPTSDGMLAIYAIVEHEEEIAGMDFWYRRLGESTYQKIQMTSGSGNHYAVTLPLNRTFRKGIEYYIEAVDRLGQKGTDGSKTNPYFVTVYESLAHPFRPVYKRWGFWAVLLGGVALYLELSDDEGDSPGTREEGGTIMITIEPS